MSLTASMGPPILLGGNLFIICNRGKGNTRASMGPPILLGGNDTGYISSDGAVQIASMGPPILLGGNPRRTGCDTRAPRCFNGATDFTRWK